MKGVVVYDSYYGNTKRVAEAILEQIKAEGLEGELRSLREDCPTPPIGDFMFVGSPVRMGAVSRKAKKFVRKLDLSAWKDKPIAVFTTIALLPKEDATDKQKQGAQKWALDPGPKFRDMAKARGLNAVDKVLFVEVKDSKGPLVDNGLEKTTQFTHELLQTLRK